MGSVREGGGPSWAWGWAPFQAAALPPNERRSTIKIQMRRSSVSKVVTGIQIQATEETLTTSHVSSPRLKPQWAAPEAGHLPVLWRVYIRSNSSHSGSSVHIQSLKTVQTLGRNNPTAKNVSEGNHLESENAFL